jgi:hypothetical protein
MSFMNTTHCDELRSILRMTHSRLTSDNIIAHGNCFASYCKRFTSHEVANDGVSWFFLRPMRMQMSYLQIRSAVDRI